MLAFSSTLDAVRCCHAAQAHILFTAWSPEAFVFSGATEHMPDGRLVFRGPRLATAIHETVEYRSVGLEPEGQFSFFSLCVNNRWSLGLLGPPPGYCHFPRPWSTGQYV